VNVKPPELQINANSSGLAPGYVFVGVDGKPTSGQNFPVIYDMSEERMGTLVWTGNYSEPFDFKTQTYKGEPVLTFFSGELLNGMKSRALFAPQTLIIHCFRLWTWLLLCSERVICRNCAFLCSRIRGTRRSPRVHDNLERHSSCSHIRGLASRSDIVWRRRGRLHLRRHIPRDRYRVWRSRLPVELNRTCCVE
jgi:hypothetical protein